MKINVGIREAGEDIPKSFEKLKYLKYNNVMNGKI